MPRVSRFRNEKGGCSDTYTCVAPKRLRPAAHFAVLSLSIRPDFQNYCPIEDKPCHLALVPHWARSYSAAKSGLDADSFVLEVCPRVEILDGRERQASRHDQRNKRF